MPKKQPGLFEALLQDPSKAMQVLTGDPAQVAQQNIDQRGMQDAIAQDQMAQAQILAQQQRENPLPPASAAPGAGIPQMPMTQALGQARQMSAPAPQAAPQPAMPQPAQQVPNLDQAKLQQFKPFGK